MYIRAGYISDNFDYELSIPSFTDTYADIDSDGGSYERTVLLENFRENQIVEMQTLFAGFEGRFRILRITSNTKVIGSISASLASATINSATYSNTANATYSGYYEDFFGITIAENGVYDFGSFNLSQTGDLEYNNSVNTVLFDAGLLILLRERLTLSGGLMYTQYQTNMFNIGNARISNDSNELNSINNLIDFDMSHASLKVGISYKF